MAKGHLAILMCTYNGMAFISQQLDSYVAQSHTDWSLWVSDDGSTDGTPEFIAQYMEDKGIKGNVFKGPGQGFCRNFQSLIARPEIVADHYAFADQDDIWCEDKFDRAINWLNEQKAQLPALYCARTELIDEHNNPIGYSPNNIKPASFGNALVQNIASGNTMVFNQKAKLLFNKVHDCQMQFHDWSLYQIVTGCAGRVYFDSKPSVLYRQHSKNVLGNGMGLMKRIKNFISTHQGQRRDWHQKNINVLRALDSELSVQARDQLAAFEKIREASLLGRIKYMKRAGMYHQSKIGGLTTLSYVLLNRL